jgi:hypothetical protein
MEYYSAIKKNEFMSFTGKCMELEMIRLSEISQTENVLSFAKLKPKKMSDSIKWGMFVVGSVKGDGDYFIHV